MTQESTKPDNPNTRPRIVAGAQLAKTRLGPPPAPHNSGGHGRTGTRLDGCLLAVVAEGSNALASGVSLEAEDSQLVLEVNKSRSAGWPWSDIINIGADGIAADPGGAWTQLLEISTADHTFRFLAPAYKVGIWISSLPAAGRNCVGALKESPSFVDSVTRSFEDPDPAQDPGDGRDVSGFDGTANGELERPWSEAELEAAPEDAHIGGNGLMGEVSKESWLGVNGVAPGTSESSRQPVHPDPVHPTAAFNPVGSPITGSPSVGSPSVGSPITGSPLLGSPNTPAPVSPETTPPDLGPTGDDFRLPRPPRNPANAASSSTDTWPIAGSEAGDPPTVPGTQGAQGSVRGNRHAKRRLFGRSSRNQSRTDNRHFASHPKPGHARPLHAQHLSASEIVRNLFTWSARPAAGLHKAGLQKAGLQKAGLQKAGLQKAGLQKAGVLETVKDDAPESRQNKRAYSTKRRFATLGLGVLIIATTAAGTAAAFQPGNSSAAPHVIGRVAPDWPQTHGLITALAPAPKLRFKLPAARSKPKPAPATLLAAPSLQSHEIFAFAPYWTLPTASTFNVANMTTLSYFGLDVNANGSINKSGDGWTGYESQDLSDLISRAHAAGDRVVLTAECFNQSTLNAVTSNPAAATTLGNELVSLVEAKSLDGVNIDFEGSGPSDQKGLDRLMARVSSMVRHADAHWQITMDTYASSAGDPDGFYDIAGLSSSVDAFFVMAYQMGGPAGSKSSQFSGSNFSAKEALQEYAQVVSSDKVILGLPFYGYSWPTTGPGASAAATGPATPVPDAQIVTTGKSVYWNTASDSAWISYKTGSHWHQTWFEDPTSLSQKAQLATSSGVRGVGIWALGMEGNDPAMLAALVGNGPVIKDYAPSPAGASTTTGPSSTTTTRPRTTTTTSPKTTSTTATSTTSTTAPSTTTTVPPTTTTTGPTTTTTDPSTTTTTTGPEETTTTVDTTTTSSS